MFFSREHPVVLLKLNNKIDFESEHNKLVMFRLKNYYIIEYYACCVPTQKLSYYWILRFLCSDSKTIILLNFNACCVPTQKLLYYWILALVVFLLKNYCIIES
jgi:hypothetical protein